LDEDLEGSAHGLTEV